MKNRLILWGSLLCLLSVFAYVQPSYAATNNKEVSVALSSRLIINNNQSVTTKRRVSLKITAPKSVKDMMISHSDTFEDASWEPYKKDKVWYLEYSSGPQVVYVRFRFKDGTITKSIRDSITLKAETPEVSVELETGDVDSRYVTVYTTMSNGIDAFRYSEKNKLKDVPFQDVTDRKKISVIIPSKKGKQTLYFEFKDVSGKSIKKSLSFTYAPSGRTLIEGSVVYGQDKKYYYYGYDGKLHIFPNVTVLRSWYPANVTTTPVSKGKVEEYKQGDPMCVRPGTYIVKFSGSTQLYLSDIGCVLRPMLSEAEGYILYGASWKNRIIELAAGYRTSYDVASFDATDTSEKISDRDKDGIGDDVESDYGTSDRSGDTDGDGLGDYEEIMYWFSDPVAADSDGDGFGDMREILNGYNPIGNGVLTSIPADTYTYPIGSVVQPKENKKIYYIRSATHMSSLGEKTNSKGFVLNYIDPQFIAHSPFYMNLPKAKGSISKKDLSIVEPYRLTDVGLVKM